MASLTDFRGVATITTMRTYFSAYMLLLALIFLVSMTTLEHASHSIRRKGYAPHYNPANIARFQPEMHDVTLELVNVPSPP